MLLFIKLALQTFINHCHYCVVSVTKQLHNGKDYCCVECVLHTYFWPRIVFTTALFNTKEVREARSTVECVHCTNVHLISCSSRGPRWKPIYFCQLFSPSSNSHLATGCSQCTMKYLIKKKQLASNLVTLFFIRVKISDCDQGCKISIQNKV